MDIVLIFRIQSIHKTAIKQKGGDDALAFSFLEEIPPRYLHPSLFQRFSSWLTGLFQDWMLNAACCVLQP
jgi:hypothetical protein